MIKESDFLHARVHIVLEVLPLIRIIIETVILEYYSLIDIE